MSSNQRKIILDGLKALLRPLARFCFNRSLKIQDFIELTKTAFIEVAAEEIIKQGDTVSVSRLSVMTGLHRRDVTRLSLEETKLGEDMSLVARVIGQWQYDRHFCQKSGKARPLELEGKNSEFTELVRSVSKDLNPYTVLFELERCGTVKRVDGKLKLEQAVYVPSGDLKQSLSLLSGDVEDMVHAVEENIFENNEVPNLHVHTQYDNICPQFIPQIKQWFLEQGQCFHQEARNFLSKFDKDLNPKLQDKEGEIRAKVGTFSRIEEAKK